MEKKTKQNKKQKQEGRAPLLGLTRFIYYYYLALLTFTRSIRYVLAQIRVLRLTSVT